MINDLVIKEYLCFFFILKESKRQFTINFMYLYKLKVILKKIVIIEILIVKNLKLYYERIKCELI